MKGWCPVCETRHPIQREEGMGTDYICTQCKTKLSVSGKIQVVILAFFIAVLWLIITTVFTDREAFGGIEIAALFLSIPPFALYALRYITFEKVKDQ
jgi:uncharacterized membrane protein YedE/YeeE